MPLRSVLLRMLLSLALVLNGATTAAAATHMQAESVRLQPAAPSAGQSSAVNVPPCHQHAAGPSAAHDDPSARTGPVPTGSKHPSPDCCKSGSCRCACMHLAQAVLPAVNTAVPPIAHDQSVRPLPLAHASPALPHLIRPPIG